jgi:rhodanese-related sulfurtransferase/membrane protein insertase Oxa1/YidC/SpoIIIJ/phosphohistidine swiveling domain-containing protein
MAGPAFAIPSPELVIGSVSSVSQLAALAAATLGGGAAAIGVRASSRNGDNGSARKARRIASALFVFFVASAGINIYQLVEHRQEERTRLEATLARPADTVGLGVVDPNLKVTSLDAQTGHELGIATADAAALLDQVQSDARDDVIFLDIRETAENETGTLPGATHVRFPDLSSSDVDLSGRQAVLFCHNGNRSSETCEKLAGMGIDCRFIVGGIEKWIVEGRPFTDQNVRTLADLRAVPHYPAQRVLLDTPEVHDLVDNEEAIFVDVRYPADFAAGHLPGAANLPVRPTPTAELKRRIAELPDKPIIAPCYDRRGCFNAEVLGLELSRAGRDFRGRYTVPWEYFIPKKPKPHIQTWIEASQRGLWQQSIDLVSDLLDAVAGKIGLLMTILLASVASRLVVLPVAVKAERDQLRSNAVAPELAALKERLRGDPARLTRAIKAFYASHGLTPVRNLLALAFLPVMMVMLSAIQAVAGNHGAALLWIGNVSAPDPLYILPLAFGILGSIYLDLVLVKSQRQRWMTWLVALPVLTGLSAILSAAGSIYLVASAVLLLVQRAVVVGKLGWFFRVPDTVREAWRATSVRSGVVPLSHVSQLVDCGNKAYRLARLRADGIAVPDGVVLCTAFLDRLESADAATKRQMLERVWNRLGAARVAVRSSAAAEDGATHSFAGIFESVLNVERGDFDTAIRDVMKSFRSDRADTYGLDPSSGNILVQEMVSPEFAGVLFTRDPQSAGAMMLEMVRGTADDLVSGRAAPDTFRYGRYSHAPLEPAEAPFDISPLLAIGARAEQLFGAPQDIEWTYREGLFQIVQSRDITAFHGPADRDRLVTEEWRRLFDLTADAGPDEVVLELTEMSEVLPRPTPLSLSLMRELWAPGGSVDLSCRKLGLKYPVEEDAPSHLRTVFGRLYSDPRRAKRNAVLLTKPAAMRLARSAGSIERRFRQEFMPVFDAEMSVMEIADFEKLDMAELFSFIERLRTDFVTSTHVEVETVNIAADFHLARAKKAIEERRLDPASVLGSADDAVPSRALADAMDFPLAERRRHLTDTLGHRAAFDYELSEPRFSETPDYIESLCSLPASEVPTQACAVPELPADVDALVQVARQYQVLKEDAKHESLRQLAVLRHALMELDRRLNLSGLIFYLTFDELSDLKKNGSVRLRPLASQRLDRRRKLLAMPALPTSLTLTDLEKASLGNLEQPVGGLSNLKGTRVSGTGAVTGRSCIVPGAVAETGSPIEDFLDGDIIVCSMVHPAWLPFVLRSGGVVSEVGGWLSHMAIVAREHDIPMIVGARGLRSIPAQSRLRLHPGGEVEVLASKGDEGEPVLKTS